MILTAFVGIFAIRPLYVMFQAMRERLGSKSPPAAQPPATGKQAELGSAASEHVAAE
jgi:hypothetical protein